MKKILVFFAALFLITSSNASVNVIEPRLNASEIFFPVGNTGKQISLMDLSQINLKDFENLTGKKLNFIDRVGFKAAQKKLKKSIDSDGTLNNKKVEKFLKRGGETGFHFGGFALGFFAGLIGVLIAYVINDDFKKNRVKWAWIGFGIIFVINIILIVAILNNIE